MQWRTRATLIDVIGLTGGVKGLVKQLLKIKDGIRIFLLERNGNHRQCFTNSHGPQTDCRAFITAADHGFIPGKGEGMESFPDDQPISTILDSTVTARPYKCSVSCALMDRVAGAGPSGAKEAPGFRASALQPRPPINPLLTEHGIAYPESIRRT